MSDFGKVRIYRCPCGATNVRPICGEPKPCPRCNMPLAGMSYEVDDHNLFVRKLLRGEEPKQSS